MVGLFGRFPEPKISRGPPNPVDEKEPTTPPKEVDPPVHGVQFRVDFNPVEHPQEPPDNDPPVKCPRPEPSILHDGRMWKQRLQVSSWRRAELPAIRKSGVQLRESHRRWHSVSNEHLMPSFSDPDLALQNS